MKLLRKDTDCFLNCGIWPYSVAAFGGISLRHLADIKLVLANDEVGKGHPLYHHFQNRIETTIDYGEPLQGAATLEGHHYVWLAILSMDAASRQDGHTYGQEG